MLQMMGVENKPDAAQNRMGVMANPLNATPGFSA
jgi:hypothetical protein